MKRNFNLRHSTKFLMSLLYLIFDFAHPITSLRVPLSTDSHTSQSKTSHNQISSLALDGDLGTCAIVDHVNDPWRVPTWEVDLPDVFNVTEVVVSMSNNPMYERHQFAYGVYVSRENNDVKILCAYSAHAQKVVSGKFSVHCDKPVSGDKVIIMKHVKMEDVLKRLILCEVSVYAEDESGSLSLRKPVSQSGPFEGNQLAVDGNLGTCTNVHKGKDNYAWLKVALGLTHLVKGGRIIFKETYSGLMATLSNSTTFKYFGVATSNDQKVDQHLCPFNSFLVLPDSGLATVNFTCQSIIPVQFVSVSHFEQFIICELEVWEVDSHSECGPVERMCVPLSKCIKKEQVCDRLMQCPDGIDELNCKCLPQEYLCKDGTCIHKNWLCDEVQDCKNGEDEGIETCLSCGADEFKCTRVNICIKLSKRCDGAPNCADFSDELYCSHDSVYKARDRGILCGSRDITGNYFGPYVIRGRMSQEGAFPWQVQVFRKDDYVCGGTIISNQWVLTAAHCFWQIKDHKDIYLKFGTSDMNDPFLPKMRITHLVTHPDYDSDKDKNDIGMIRLEMPIAYTKLVRPVCLPERSMSDIARKLTFSYCLVSGFGHIDNYFASSKHLLHGRMDIMSDLDCALNLEIAGADPAKFKKMLQEKNFFCAGPRWTRSGTNACRGDRGGPLVCRDRFGKWTQAGLVALSESKDLGNACTSTLFLKLDRYVNFIDSVFSAEYQMTSMMTRKIQNTLSMILLVIVNYATV